MIKNSIAAVRGKILTHEIRAKTDDISAYKNYTIFRDIFRVSKGELKKALEVPGRTGLNSELYSRRAIKPKNSYWGKRKSGKRVC